MSVDEVRIIGDIHGKVEDYISVIQDFDGKTIQVGDFGFEKEYNMRDDIFEDMGLNSSDHVFVPGNHDDYDHLPNWSLGDYGKIPFIPDSFFVRGALSIDKEHRTQGYDWWEEEQLSYTQSMGCMEEYGEVKPEIVISHEGPSIGTERMWPSAVSHKSLTKQLLDNLFESHKPDIWIFGHWHETKEKVVKGTRFICLGELDFIDLEV